jgi:hypothetical protein
MLAESDQKLNQAAPRTSAKTQRTKRFQKSPRVALIFSGLPDLALRDDAARIAPNCLRKGRNLENHSSLVLFARPSDDCSLACSASGIKMILACPENLISARSATAPIAVLAHVRIRWVGLGYSYGLPVANRKPNIASRSFSGDRTKAIDFTFF